MGKGDIYFINVHNLCERQQNPTGTQMMMLPKKTILILFLMCRIEREVNTVSKPQGSWRIFLAFNCTIVSVSIETDGIGWSVINKTELLKYTEMFPKTGKVTHTPFLKWNGDDCALVKEEPQLKIIWSFNKTKSILVIILFKGYMGKNSSLHLVIDSFEGLGHFAIYNHSYLCCVLNRLPRSPAFLVYLLLMA